MCHTVVGAILNRNCCAFICGPMILYLHAVCVHVNVCVCVCVCVCAGGALPLAEGGVCLLGSVGAMKRELRDKVEKSE